mmetsp:Transcript_95519/g.309502  ORF Transcript_95519/g.309502 Transcript_95519/m.309502 type:complete len:262 (-) Transcript_95519:1027-1812(-)
MSRHQWKRYRRYSMHRHLAPMVVRKVAAQRAIQGCPMLCRSRSLGAWASQAPVKVLDDLRRPTTHADRHAPQRPRQPESSSCRKCRCRSKGDAAAAADDGWQAAWAGREIRTRRRASVSPWISTKTSATVFDVAPVAGGSSRHLWAPRGAGRAAPPAPAPAASASASVLGRAPPGRAAGRSRRCQRSRPAPPRGRSLPGPRSPPSRRRPIQFPGRGWPRRCRRRGPWGPEQSGEAVDTSAARPRHRRRRRATARSSSTRPR